ncbi:hypothetical protein EB796_020180 [Bugula neritina]|uniref:Uncharacterized protein n=1 Tax=Bugula neritina TaxID=10212 RepID=A0A7J7J5R9_BUGNE|nr:hypothetical protein EB796_020180 [Bugula neritina]
MPTARKVGKAESAEKVKVGKGKLPSDAIPDWALYASIFFGFIGMILIGIAVAKRSERPKESAKKKDNSGALPLDNSKDIEAPKEVSKTFLTVPNTRELQPKLSAVSIQPAALNVLNTAT